MLTTHKLLDLCFVKMTFEVFLKCFLYIPGMPETGVSEPVKALLLLYRYLQVTSTANQSEK